MTISRTEFEMMEMRIEAGRRVKTPKVEIVDAFEGAEEDLAQLCIAEIVRRRWYYTRNRPGRRSTATSGTTDLIIGADQGRTFYCELKRNGNKLSDKQVITKHVLLALGHRWECVYSFPAFLDFINEKWSGEYICPKCGLRRDGQHGVRESKF